MKDFLLAAIFILGSLSARAQFVVPFSYWKSMFGALTISDGPTYNYGILPINNNFDKTLTITNSGAIMVNNMRGTGTSVYTFKGGTYPGTNGTCATFLSAGSTCTVVLTANSSTTGNVNGSLTLNYTDTLGGPYISRRPVTGFYSSTTITSIFVTPSTGTFAVGDTRQIKCYANTSDGGTIDITNSSSWASANPARVSVDNTTQKGLITGVANGAAVNVTATYGSFSASVAVTVAAGAPVFNDPGIGLYARYFSSGTASTPNDPYVALQNNRIDATVDFNWASGANPAGGLDIFGAKWTGQITAPTTNTYCMGTRSDDGVRLWIDGQLIINNWSDHSPTDNTGTFAFTANVKYDIFAEFYENAGGAEMRIRYLAGACGTPSAAVAQANLYPTATRGLDLQQYTAPRYTNMYRGFTMNGTVGAIANGAAITGMVGGGGATPVNAVASNVNGAGMAYISSQRSQALSFDGVDDYVSVAASTLPTAAAARSVLAWVRPTNTGATMPVTAYGNNSATNGFTIEILSTGIVRLNTVGSQCDSNSTIDWATWNFIGVTLTGTTARVYIDGALDSTCTITTPATSAASTLYIGRNIAGSAVYTGAIEDIGYWNLVLTAGEVNTMYERGRVVNPP